MITSDFMLFFISDYIILYLYYLYVIAVQSRFYTSINISDLDIVLKTYHVPLHQRQCNVQSSPWSQESEGMHCIISLCISHVWWQ